MWSVAGPGAYLMSRCRVNAHVILEDLVCKGWGAAALPQPRLHLCFGCGLALSARTFWCLHSDHMLHAHSTSCITGSLREVLQNMSQGSQIQIQLLHVRSVVYLICMASSLRTSRMA